MTKKIATILATSVLSLFGLVPSAATQKATANILSFTHVTVIDATGAPAAPDMTVVITDGRVSDIGKTGRVRVPAGAREVNASGKFMIPGLWDMHVHWFEKDYLPLFMANGVTGIREMSGTPDLYAWHKEVESGALPGPRMMVASPVVDGPDSVNSQTKVANDAEARAVVRASKQAGADFIKIYFLLSRETFFAIADETKKQGLSFVGHVPQSVSAVEASDAGMKSIEHLNGILEASSTREEEVHKMRDRAYLNRPKGAGPDIPLMFRTFELMLESFSPEKSAIAFAHYKRNHTWQVPTLTVARSIAFIDYPERLKDPRLKYMPPAVRNRWTAQAAGASSDLFTRLYKKYLEIVGMMHRDGVEILAGTDTLNPFCFPGFSLHDELGLLVEAGLTPMAALQSATINPARFMGKEKDLGTIQKGKIADVVLLDANPLENIANTQRINAVVTNGHMIDRTALDEMLARVETIAK